MKEPFPKSDLMSLRSRILLYTLVPALAVFILAGGIMSGSVRSMITKISGDEILGSTRLSCSRIESVLDDYCTTAVSKASEINVKRFLQTAENRDDMEDNAYFSYAIGELDSTISDSNFRIDHVWLASSSHPGVAFSNTSAGWTANEDFDITQCFFYDDLIHSEKGVFVTDPYVSPVTNTLVFTVAAAVKDVRTNAVLGVYSVCFDTECFADRIYSVVNSDGNEIIISSSNDIIIYSTDSSLIETAFSKIDFEETDTIGAVKHFYLSDNHMIGSVNYPDRCSWTIYGMRDYSDTESLKMYYVRLTALIFIGMALVMFLTITIVSRRIARPIQNYTRMINDLNIHSGEAIDDDYLLVPEGCSELEQLAVGFNSLVKRNQEIMGQLRDMNVRSEKQRILYQTALASSADVIFEYDIASDELISYGSAIDASMPKTIPDVTLNFLEKIAAGEKYRTSDISAAEEFLKGITKNELVLEIVIEAETHWLSFEGTAVYSEEEAVKIVGKIRCIDDVVRIREEAQKDQFSGFYNKSATEKIITQKLSAKPESAAIILVDVDNFKSINDFFGHDYGDFVIKDVSKKIGSCISKEDTPGRIGGDEFMLYLPKADHTIVSEMCQKLCDRIRFTYTSESSTEKVSISASIGAAIFPAHGRSFDELYRSADIAMYHSKTGGKNRFTVFDGQERTGYQGERR